MKQAKLNPSKSTGLKMSKKKRKFRAMTNMEFYRKFCGVVYCGQSSFNRKPYQTKDGKYLFIEVKNERDIIQRTGKKKNISLLR